MAQQLHLSKFYISHVFRQRMQIGFTEFINNLRIKCACELLQKGHSITETAFSSGFTSIRTFNRVFLKEIGLSPSEYILQKNS
jgi:AraC-like DNA-binding protein